VRLCVFGAKTTRRPWVFVVLVVVAAAVAVRVIAVMAALGIVDAAADLFSLVPPLLSVLVPLPTARETVL
jgi:hypothetical protein